MRKPDGYDEMQAVRHGANVLPAGGYVCQIINARETHSKSGKRMLVLELDIIEGAYKGHFARIYKKRLEYNPAAVYPCKFYRLIDGAYGELFKGLIEIIEESNASFSFNWNETTLRYKKIGMIFQREEYLKNDGETAWSCKPASPEVVKDIQEGNFRIPDDKPLGSSKKRTYAQTPDVSVEEQAADDDLPF
jgi:hypothetical protein